MAPEAHDAALLPYIVAVLSAVFAMLLGALSWIGSQITRRLDALTSAVGVTNSTLSNIERDLRGELARLDRRVSVIEARCAVHPPQRAGE